MIPRTRATHDALLAKPWWLLGAAFLIVYFRFVVDYGLYLWHASPLDLPSFYTAAVQAFRHGLSPYDLEGLRGLMPREVRVFPFLYPPPSLLLFLPLSPLTYAGASHAVLLLNHLLFVALAWLIPIGLLRASPQRSLGVLAFCLVYSLCFHPAVQTIQYGQVNIVCLAALTLFWLLARDNRHGLAALFLALAILIKTYPAIIVPMLLLIGRFRLSLYSCAWLGLAALASFVFLPVSLWHDWLVHIAPTGGYMRTPEGLFAPAAIWNQGLNGFVARLFTESEWSRPLLVAPALARGITYAGAALLFGVTSLVVWRVRAQDDGLDRMMLVVLPLMFLIAPFSWYHHLVLVLPVLLMLMASRTLLGPGAKAIYHGLCFALCCAIALQVFWPYEFYVVLLLWLTCVFVAGSKAVRLTAP